MSLRSSFFFLSLLISGRSNAYVCHVLIKMINEEAIDFRVHTADLNSNTFFLPKLYFRCFFVCVSVRGRPFFFLIGVLAKLSGITH